MSKTQTIKINSTEDLIKYGQDFAKSIKTPAVIELIGDVGAGKTTFTRGLAEGLNIKNPVTSPSFTISKRYAFSQNGQDCTLVHYDFYRLKDPGIMYEDIAESISDPHAITVVEWGESVSDLLPDNHYKIEIKINPDNTRDIIVS